MAVVLGEADIYAHSGGQYEWDSAARWASPPAGLRVAARRVAARGLRPIRGFPIY
jgi:hypothetical protein